MLGLSAEVSVCAASVQQHQLLRRRHLTMPDRVHLHACRRRRAAC